MPFSLGCVRLGVVAITRTTIHRKFYGALIVFAGSARHEELRKEAFLGIRFEFAPFVAHLTPFESRLEERIYPQALRYFPVAQHGQGRRRGVLGCFRKRPIHLPTAIDARTRSSTFSRSATLITRLLTASCFYGEPPQSGRRATGLTYFPRARDGLGEGVLFELSSASALI